MLVFVLFFVFRSFLPFSLFFVQHLQYFTLSLVSFFVPTADSFGGQYKTTQIAAQFWLDRQLERLAAAPQCLMYCGTVVHKPQYTSRSTWYTFHPSCTAARVLWQLYKHTHTLCAKQPRKGREKVWKIKGYGCLGFLIVLKCKWGKQRHRGTALHCHCLPLFYISHFCFIFTIIENVLLAIWFELQTSWSPNLYADQWATEDPPFHLFLFIHFSPKKLNIWYAPMIWDGILFAMEKC